MSQYKHDDGIELQAISRNDTNIQHPQQTHQPASFVLEPTADSNSRIWQESTIRHHAKPSLHRWWNGYICQHLTLHDFDGHKIHDVRDFYALERTYLAYIRTADRIAMLGVLAVQLFILNNEGVGYGRALATSAYAVAIVIAILSSIRIIAVQDDMVSGRISLPRQLMLLVLILMVALMLAIFIAALKS